VREAYVPSARWNDFRKQRLCGPSALIDDLRPHCPPWSVSLPGQLAAFEALNATDYYQAQWRGTHPLREELQQDLEALGWEVIPGCANFLLCHLPGCVPDTTEVSRRSRRAGLFLREVSNMGSGLDRYALRVAVKDRHTNHRIRAILHAAVRETVSVS
jgi:histidinol-phosphate/aromatic aminotransferase/cobyric acid decarboxylase-like protein